MRREPPLGPPEREAPEARQSLGPEALPPEDSDPREERLEREEERRRGLNTSPVTGNTTNNPDNNIVSRTLEGNGGLER